MLRQIARLILLWILVAITLFYFLQLNFPQRFPPNFFIIRKALEEKFALAIKYFPFNYKDAIKEWEAKIFNRKVVYKINFEQGNGYLKAFSYSAASGIYHKVNFNPSKESMISWKWRVVRFPDKKNLLDKSDWIEKDDYAARFYVIFPAVLFFNSKSLEYVWDERLPEGEIYDCPYSKNIKIFVCESGDKNCGNWVKEERNVYEDYKKAFGKEPGNVGAIAVMTDSDNISSTAEADYDDMKVGYKNEK